VGATGVLALLRAREEAEAEQVLAGVYLVSTKSLLKKKLAEVGQADRLRLYLGYCGWGPGQLLRELEMGAWHLMQGEEKLVFDPEPETLWQRLIARTELILVRAAQAMTIETGS
jgi:putative transcriptional regulator